MAVFPFQYVNRRGIPVLKTTGVTVETTGVVLCFPFPTTHLQIRGTEDSCWLSWYRKSLPAQRERFPCCLKPTGKIRI